MGRNNDLVPGFDDEKPEELTIRLEATAGPSCMVVNLAGNLHTYNSSTFIKRMDYLIARGYSTIIINMAEVPYVSSMGIGAFTHLLKSLNPLSGEVVLVNVQPGVYDIFQLLGFNNFFHMGSSVREAVAAALGQGVPAQSTFPAIVSCPNCSKKLKAPKPGRFRCSECRSILTIDNKAHAFAD